MTRRYAATTSVPVSRTRDEIERTLTRYGATAFAYLAQGDSAAIIFEIQHRRVAIRLPMPNRADREFTHTETGTRRRAPASADQAYDTAVRARWRALLLVIKAKLEAVTAGITSIEREFLADVQLPTGATVGEWVQPQLDEVYGRGTMPALLPGSGR